MERRFHRRRLLAAPGMVLDDLRCEGGTPGWSQVGIDQGYAVVLVRRGGFLRRSGGEESFLDPSGGYLSRHGDEEQFAFPLGGHDRCTVIGLSPAAYHEHVEAAPDRSWRLVTDAAFDLRHRLLLAAGRRGLDRMEAGERLLDLLGHLSPEHPRRSTSPPRAATRQAHRRLVSAVQEALSGGWLTADLDQLARTAGSSPGHLSRVFHRVTGSTISAYRNQLRVRAVLEEVAAGASDLGSLAARYGFADHAHLTRTVRRHVAEPPAALRPRLSTDVQATGSGHGTG